MRLDEYLRDDADIALRAAPSDPNKPQEVVPWHGLFVLSAWNGSPHRPRTLIGGTTVVDFGNYDYAPKGVPTAPVTPRPTSSPDSRPRSTSCRKGGVRRLTGHVGGGGLTSTADHDSRRAGDLHRGRPAERGRAAPLTDRYLTDSILEIHHTPFECDKTSNQQVAMTPPSALQRNPLAFIGTAPRFPDPSAEDRNRSPRPTDECTHTK
ncbi:hypothetical protein [Saccharothrix sp. Mg75]|uniref:hypothetical protein n=1 Tax=Saccharothrix sp. Mg75 TaxID=3445357 RepID=UPI003EEBCE10